MRSIVEFELSWLLAYLIKTWEVWLEILNWNKSAISVSNSLCIEWLGNKGSYKQTWFTLGWKSAGMDSEMSRLVERPWLQLMCCAVCLPRGHNFRWKEESLSGCEYWLVYRRWTLEIEFNKRLSLSIIRLANYSVTTSLIYKLIV